MSPPPHWQRSWQHRWPHPASQLEMRSGIRSAIGTIPYHFRTVTLFRTLLRLILPIPYCKPAQKLVANAERPCAVNVKSCSSGGTAWRRKIFRNSRVNGAPLTVFEFESIVIACIRVAVCAFPVAPVIDLVAGLLAGTGRFSHFSMIIVLALRPIE